MNVQDAAGRRYHVIVTGLADHPLATLSRPLAAVLVCRPAHVTATDMARLTDLYRLTPAESRVAQHLLGGGDIASAADRLGTSRETVRTHLRHLFEKTTTHRQPDLTRVLLTSLGDF